MASKEFDAATLRPLHQWHDDIGCVLWWAIPVCEPPWVGTPVDSDWPGYHTHWTPIIEPNESQNEPECRTKEKPDCIIKLEQLKLMEQTLRKLEESLSILSTGLERCSKRLSKL